MRILQVAHSFLPYTTAGTEVYSYRLAKELAKRHEVFVFFRFSDRKKKEYCMEYLEGDSLKTYRINYAFRDFNSFSQTYRNNIIDKKFAEVLDKTKPDIVHIHHLLFLSHGIVDEVKKKGIPIVFTLHDYWLMCYRGQLINDQLNICADKTTCKDCLKYLLSIKKYSMRSYSLIKKIMPENCLKLFKKAYLHVTNLEFYSELEKWEDSAAKVCSTVGLFIAPSNFIRKKFIGYGIPMEKCVYFSNGIDCKNITFSCKNKSNLLRFGYLGALMPVKAPDILISAFKGINNRNIELLIYGKVPPNSSFENYFKILQKTVRSDKKIKLMGGYNNSEVGRILTDIDVLVIPSIWYENSPLVIQEAFLSKTPVIASRIGGIPELVSDRVNGLLFKPADAQDLQSKIQYVIDNPDILEKFRSNIPKVKSIEDNAKEIEEIYNNLIEK